MLQNFILCSLGMAMNLVQAAPYKGVEQSQMITKDAGTVPEVCKPRSASFTIAEPQTASIAVEPLPSIKVSMDPAVKELLESKKAFIASPDYTLPEGKPGIVLKATYFYTCGLTGSHSRRFTWAAHHGEHDELALVPVLNIDSFTGLEANVPQPGGYRAIWVAVWEVAYANLCCKFFASGHIEGHNYVESVAMSLVGLNGPEGRRPYVSEDCTAGEAPPNRAGHACTITYVNVEREQ